MYRGPERGKFSEWSQQVSRRRFLRLGAEKAAEIAACTGLATTVFGAVVYSVVQSERGPEVLTGESINDQIRTLTTDMYGDNPPILREEPSLDDKEISGTIEPGTVVKMREVYGPTYPTNQPADFRIVAKGRVYGVWFELINPIQIRTKDGLLEERTGFIAGNFLRKPTEEELQTQK